MKSTMFLLMVTLACITYQLMVYQALLPKLVWSIDTLWIDFNAQRQLALK